MFIRKPWYNKLNLSNNVCYDSKLKLNLTSSNPFRYPDETRVYDILSRYYDVPSTNLAVGFGLSELIHRILRLFKDKKVSVLTPTWLMAQGYCDVEGINYVEGVDFSADILYVASPNGQSGRKDFNPDWLDKFEYIILDEAYGDFSDESWLNNRPKNVILCKSLSKSLALPGVRFGWCFAEEDIIFQLQQTRPSPPISTDVEEHLEQLLDLLPDHIHRMLETRDYIESRYACHKSYGNFVLLKNKESFLDKVLYRTFDGVHRMSLTDLSTFKKLL